MTYVDWHRGIRKAYPDALLHIPGDTIDELVVINQETGQPFAFDQALAASAYETVAAEQARTQAEQSRAAAYRCEADPLFFKAQRGEATTDEWTAKVAEIKARFPYPGADQ